MKRFLPTSIRMTALVLGCLILFGLTAGQTPPVQGQIQNTQKFAAFDKVIEGAKQHDGLFKLYHKDDQLYAEIQRHQLDKPLLCPIAIARGMAMGGYTLNFDEQWVLLFKQVNDKLQLIRRNVRYQAKQGSPAAKAVETTYTDSVLLALRIHSIHPVRQSILISLNDIFMSDFAQLRLGAFDPNRSSWHKVKAFPKNIEIQVAATYSGSAWGHDSVIDSRGTTVVIHYGLAELPQGGYQPRLADDRVGHFLSVVKDYSTDSQDSAFLRYVNRWRLERADTDPKNAHKLSPPKKKIVYWIEKSVPEEYRAYVREGILEWNKAFEKIGFRDAIEVRQQEDEDFDPEDINYNTFRWITTGRGFAMGPSRVNPLTGEILDADIIFDADMVRFWRQENQLFRGDAAPASLIQAARQGWGLSDPLLAGRQGAPLSWDRRPHQEADAQTRLRAIRQGVCQCGTFMKYELGLAAMATAARGLVKSGDKVPEDLVGQAIKFVTMHEVGHTLGLRHNFKASTMLDAKDLHNTAITRKRGLVGSVMDYTPVNLAPKGVKQGDYFSTTLGPYDYWAIEYAYKPLPGGTEGEYDKLKDIASRCAKPELIYGTDEDLYGTPDPMINVWDLGSDPMKFAQDRMLLAEELLKGLGDRVVDKGEGYQRARLAFSVLLQQYGNGAHLVANFVGGVYVHRDHRNDPDGRDPMVPVKAAKQREALKFLQEHILSDKQFQFSPKLLRRLAADRWMHWGNERLAFQNVEFPLHERILGIQRLVLNQLFNPRVLARIQNNTLQAEEEQPLKVAEVFRCLTDGIWSDLSANGKDGKRRPASSVMRRNLQREHLKDLIHLVLHSPARQGVPPDARSLARMHLRDIRKRVDAALNDKGAVQDDTVRAHLEECHERIDKALAASMRANLP